MWLSPRFWCGAALTLATAFVAGGAAGEPLHYTLDSAHSWVQFELLHFGTSTIRGRLGPAKGYVELDRASGQGSVGIEIATGSVDTGIKPFDARIRRPDLLDTDANPTAWFISRQLQFDGERLVSLRGELTLRGTSQPLTLTATRFACHDDAITRRQICGGDFEAEIKRSDFGMHFGLPLVGDAVRLRVQVEGVRADR
ncbi:YceI family protein [Methylibium sp.]|uniref:YceI family protein n=1 Tax=Methylibium sp. TaxID=2067992 RepID=UPI00286C2CF9|nr:YceI family protein [Methylibium sp.]